MHGRIDRHEQVEAVVYAEHERNPGAARIDEYVVRPIKLTAVLDLEAVLVLRTPLLFVLVCRKGITD